MTSRNLKERFFRDMTFQVIFNSFTTKKAGPPQKMKTTHTYVITLYIFIYIHLYIITYINNVCIYIIVYRY